MKSYLQFLSLLLFLSGCVIANKVHWQDTDASTLVRVKNNPTTPDLSINFAKCEEGFTILPFFIIWDNKKYDYALELNISTGDNVYQKLNSFDYEILDASGNGLAKGNMVLDKGFRKWGDDTFTRYSINAKTDYYIKADNIQGDLTLNLVLYLTKMNGEKVSFSYPNEKLRRKKWKRFQFFHV
ncbi:hypothetical protein [uncultured Pontibacter sp.]|uniref:hypothetical protein n=1 Tax=uncultured Pontibacter sp. TaxID=453356 RepID=UPI00260F06D7|nr:hypothetical protein [uncultured Pontibacter sp.]